MCSPQKYSRISSFVHASYSFPTVFSPSTYVREGVSKTFLNLTKLAARRIPPKEYAACKAWLMFLQYSAMKLREFACACEGTAMKPANFLPVSSVVEEEDEES